MFCDKMFWRVVTSVVLLGLFAMFPSMGYAAQYKVLVVMSYETDFFWDQDQREGIESVLGESCEIKFFQLDTRLDFEAGETKAKEAFALYEEFQPDGVIVSDDNAQKLFTIPYLRDKVKTPVMFCGVNAAPEEYGYPASNVSGILERIHFNESIGLAQQLVPAIETIGYLFGDNATSQAFVQQAQGEAETYPAESVAFKFAKDLEEAVTMAKELSSQADVLFTESLRGLKDKDGNPREEPYIVPLIQEAFGKPTLAANANMIKYGLLCAVVKTGQEQGKTAGTMLLQAMQGTPVSEIPISQNHQGKQIINVTVLKALGIKAKPAILRGAELVRTAK